MSLLQKSINVILDNQSNYGSFIASPEFNIYQFSWIRDSSFIAYALDKAGEFEAAEEFFIWVNKTIEKYASKVFDIEKALNDGSQIEKSKFLNARFKLSGCIEKDTGWGNFQLDAYGTWLWALSQHIKFTGKSDLINKFSKSIDLTIRYIRNLWYYPNYDVWEENGDKIHTATLACLYGGLNCIGKYVDSEEINLLKNRIRSYILTNCIKEDRFVKYIGTKEVDASLLWLALPFQVVTIDNPIFKNTVEKIEHDLLSGCGMHRYKKDTYYGGGEWILLSCWIGCYYAKTGDRKRAENIKTWVESSADSQGFLPEQVCNNMNDGSYYDYWVKKWGKPAIPLIWSHAMYIILNKAIDDMKLTDKKN